MIGRVTYHAYRGLAQKLNEILMPITSCYFSRIFFAETRYLQWLSLNLTIKSYF